MYGGEEHLNVPSKSLLLAQTEDYVEYSRSGKIIKGQEQQIIKSRYEEDILINNHTLVWGSYWHSGHWGYKCCHSLIKNSYCVGESGKMLPPAIIPVAPVVIEEKEVIEAEAEIPNDDSSDKSSDEEEKVKSDKKSKKKKSKKKKQKEKRKEKKKRSGPEDKLQDAIDEEARRTEKIEHLLSLDERKRPYNSMYDVKVPTEQDIEAYMMKRRREDDPMLQFMDKD